MAMALLLLRDRNLGQLDETPEDIEDSGNNDPDEKQEEWIVEDALHDRDRGRGIARLGFFCHGKPPLAAATWSSRATQCHGHRHARLTNVKRRLSSGS